jgi:alkylation response protein AidB-like acyl-CoA dehydrogenase
MLVTIADLAATRGGAAWKCAGHAVACYEAALTYAKERTQFGKSIAGFQLIQNKLANMLAEITAMQLICFRMAQPCRGSITMPATMGVARASGRCRVYGPMGALPAAG